MKKIEQVLNELGVDCQSHSRLAEESFGSEVYLIKTLEGEKILKFSHNEGKFWREIKTLEFFRSALPVPEILATVQPEAEMNGAILMNRISGRAISNDLLTKEVAESCGELLGRMHSVAVQDLGCFGKDGFMNFPFSGWWDYRKDLVLGSWTDVIETAVEPNLLQACKDVLNEFYGKINSSELCWIHCDYRPGNLLVDQSVTGVIDFESARTGDAAYDFIKFYEVLAREKPEVWESFLNGYSKFKQLPDLERLIPYYEFELNYGFLYWATARSDKELFQKRLANVQALLKRHP